MIDYLFEWLILKSVGISALLLLIIALRPLILRWSSANIAYGLWLMLPIYLVLPNNFVEVTSTDGVMTFFLGANSLSLDLTNQQNDLQNQLTSWLLSVWLGGVSVSLSIFLFRYRRLLNSLQSMNSPPIARQVKNILIQNNGQNKQRPTCIVSSSLIDLPAIFGLFRTHLILPDDFVELSQQHREMILRHELYHLGRHDHQFNFLRVFVKSLFWFNPIFYWADKYCEADQEMSYDFGVMQHFDSNGRNFYATTLLESVVGLKQNRMISQWKYQSLIKERVKMLKNIKSKKWHTWFAAVFAASSIWLTSGVVMAEKEQVSDSGAIPLSIIQPRYPRKAAMEGIEGWVKFRFNIDSNGHPYEVEFVDAEPKQVFERDAMRAIYQWTFKTDGGQKNLVYTMEFRLEAPEDAE